MSRANTPKDNAVAERFMRTFKEHKINNKKNLISTLLYVTLSKIHLCNFKIIVCQYNK